MITALRVGLGVFVGVGVSRVVLPSAKPWWLSLLVAIAVGIVVSSALRRLLVRTGVEKPE